METEEPEELGTCAWCSRPVYSDEEYEEGDDGTGIMHRDCTPGGFWG